MTRDLNLGLVGNGSFSALLDPSGEVVWSCMPRFDSSPVFCSLLNADGGDGRFAVELTDCAHSEQRYLDNTAILVTTLHDHHGNAVEITDFAPRFKQYGRTFRPVTLVRQLRPVHGSPRVCVRLRPVFGYGATAPAITQGSNHIRYVGPDQVLRLTTDASLTAVMDEMPIVLDREVTLLLGPDETVPAAVGEIGRQFLEETRAYWEEWVRYLAIPFEWQDAVIRAAITLKLSAYEDTGAVVAAMTTSVPEAPDSRRNWDYRYCWPRDGYFVVNALNRLGATKTMEEYLRYIINISAGSPDNRLLPVYRLNGRTDLDEHEVPHLAGYRGMGPVRVGNQAFRQTQNDVYGAAILAAAHVFFDRRIRRPGDVALFRRLEGLGEEAARIYRQPDAGLWEFRGFERTHTFSALMCWAGCRTLARIASHLGERERADVWAGRARTIARDIDREAWDERRNTYVASFGGSELDASLLLMYELGYLRHDDPRLAGTVAAIEKELGQHRFLFRYAGEDDFGRPGVAFIVCTFWYVDALAGLGRRDEARALFQELLACRNHLGLLSEDVDPASGELWGNFPQTYSMVGLINSAMRLSRSWEEAF